MELEFTTFARAQMGFESVSRLEVEAVFASPDAVEAGEIYMRYMGTVGGRRLILFVLVDSDPPKVGLLEVE